MSSVWTIDEINEQIALYKGALKACSTGKAYEIKGRSLTRHDLAEIRAQLKYFADEKSKLEGTSGPLFVQGRVHRG